jgi:hypothetical protein
MMMANPLMFLLVIAAASYVGVVRYARARAARRLRTAMDKYAQHALTPEPRREPRERAPARVA